MKVRQVPIGSVLDRRNTTIDVDPARTYAMFGVRNNFKGAFDAGELSGSETKYRTLNRASAGDLVYLKLGAWERAFAIIPDALDGRHASSEFVLYRPDTSEVDPRYLRHLIAWPTIINRIGGKSTGTNVRRRRLSPDVFETAMIPLPSLSDQRRLASYLDALAAPADHARRTADSATALSTSLLEQAFRAASSETVSLGEILTFNRRGVAVDVGTTYRNSGILNRGRGLFSKADLLGADTKYSTLYELSAGQVVYSKLFAWEGAVAIVDESHAGSFVSSEFPTFDVDLDRVTLPYLAHALRSSRVTEALAVAGSGLGQRRQRVNLDAFLAIRVPLPLKEVQERVARRLDQASRASAAAGRVAKLATALVPSARDQVFAELVRSSE